MSPYKSRCFLANEKGGFLKNFDALKLVARELFGCTWLAGGTGSKSTEFEAIYEHFLVVISYSNCYNTYWQNRG